MNNDELLDLFSGFSTSVYTVPATAAEFARAWNKGLEEMRKPPDCTTPHVVAYVSPREYVRLKLLYERTRT